MKIPKTYSGVVVPMVTPLTSRLAIDTHAVEKINSLFTENNISPLVLGTTGESASLDATQSLALVKAIMAAKGKGQKIYAGLVSNQVNYQIEQAKRFFDLGCDVVVATLPAYYSLTPDQMLAFYDRLAGNIPGPLMMYNIKATTQMSIPLDVVSRLSEHDNILGLKDSERDSDRLKTCIETYRERPDFSFFCGWGAQSLNSLRWGADGIVPSTGNIVPELYHQLYSAVRNNDMETAERCQLQTDEVAQIYQANRTLGQSLATLKVMMANSGLCEPFMMPPLTELEDMEAIQKISDHYFKKTSQL